MFSIYHITHLEKTNCSSSTYHHNHGRTKSQKTLSHPQTTPRNPQPNSQPSLFPRIPRSSPTNHPKTLRIRHQHNSNLQPTPIQSRSISLWRKYMDIYIHSPITNPHETNVKTNATSLRNPRKPPHEDPKTNSKSQSNQMLSGCFVRVEFR